jgi:hypothetical protein
MMSKYPAVRCVFYDHFQADSPSLQPVRCAVYGKLAKEDDLCYYILSWICEGDMDSRNSDGHCIIKSTVIKLTYLEEVNESASTTRYKRSKKDYKDSGVPVEPGFSGGSGEDL